MWLFFWEEWRVTCFRSLDDIFRAQSWKIVETEEVPTFLLSSFLPLSNHSPLLFTRISARLIHSLSLQTKINDMNTSSYSREPFHQQPRAQKVRCERGNSGSSRRRWTTTKKRCRWRMRCRAISDRSAWWTREERVKNERA